MATPSGIKYSKEHEWVRVEGNVAVIGITDHAQEQLGDIVMVEFPEIGSEVAQTEAFGVVESVKSVSDCFAPVSGKVLEVNEPLVDSPGVVNEDAYGEGWLIKVEMSDESEIDDLMEADEYEAFLAEA